MLIIFYITIHNIVEGDNKYPHEKLILANE